MKVFTIEEGMVEIGATLKMIAGAQSGYPAITVGEDGRGRKLGLVPVVGARLVACPNNGKSCGYHTTRTRDGLWRCAVCASQCVNGVHPEGWYAPDRVTDIMLDKSKSGRHLFRIAPNSGNGFGSAIVVLRTPIGFRGGNRHQGVHGGEFPLEVLMDGTIAQGDAGAMGSGKQYVALVKPGQSWKAIITGRRYGKPSEYYYVYDGNTVFSSETLEQFIDEGLIAPTTNPSDGLPGGEM